MPQAALAPLPNEAPSDPDLWFRLRPPRVEFRTGGLREPELRGVVLRAEALRDDALREGVPRFAALPAEPRPAALRVLLALVRLEPDETDEGGGFSEPARDRAVAGERVGMVAR